MAPKNKPEKLRVELLPIRDTVIPPGLSVSFFVGRKSSVAAVRSALEKDKKLFVLTQKFSDQDNPTSKDMNRVGVYGEILQTMRASEGKIKVLFLAGARYQTTRLEMDGPHPMAEIVRFESLFPEPSDQDKILIHNVLEYARNHFSKNSGRLEEIFKKDPEEINPETLADALSPFLENTTAEKQKVLEIADVYERLEAIYSLFLSAEEYKKTEKKLKDRIQKQIGKSHKEYFLNEQMKAIQKELGEENAELTRLQEQIDSSGMTKEAKEVAEREIKKLKMLSPMSSEGNMIRGYLDWLLAMPWKKKTRDDLNLEKAQTILDQDHYGLEKVKERIIEHMAVTKQVKKIKGPILCLTGPPGVGKTSLARSVARVLGRKFARISLGGIRDEAEIRGHRRTYIGSMPGKILQTMKKVKTRNPLILLDEVDKITKSVMGDPSAALLEVLDPEQNRSFMDHYLEVEYDLSDVLFFCTANTPSDIPEPLYDRMEVIPLSGYTELEKKAIFKEHLLPKQFEENGIKNFELKISDAIILQIIRHYTKEAGVRNLERLLGKICRKALIKHSFGPDVKRIQVTKNRLKEFLGQPSFRYGLQTEKDLVGSATGLAWTRYGGDLLRIEVLEMPGKGEIQLTGKLGDVMKESGKTALSYVRHHAHRWGIRSRRFRETDLHVHVPEGAVPKDGPSAGITLTTALISSLTGIPVRRQVAMTGEVTLQGNVLPIGGLKEKLLAAKRGGIREIIIPIENRKDLEEIPEEVTKELKIIPVADVSDVISLALASVPKAIEKESFSAEESDGGPIPKEPENQIAGNH